MEVRPVMASCYLVMSCPAFGGRIWYSLCRDTRLAFSFSRFPFLVVIREDSKAEGCHGKIPDRMERPGMLIRESFMLDFCLR